MCPTVSLIGYAAFGLELRSELQLPGAWQSRTPSAVATELRMAGRDEVEGAFSGFARRGWRGRQPGGRWFDAQIGVAGDHRFAYGDEAVFHLTAEGETLTCCARDPDDLEWQRVLLDSVLFSIALIAGRDALHCGAVQTPRGAVALAAASGAGKSTLTAQLVREGAALVTDDVLAISSTGSDVTAFPGPPVMNLPSGMGDLGEAIAVLGDEVWAAVPVVPDPLPIAAVVLLDRRPGLQLGVEPLDAGPLALIPHLMRFPDSSERARRRFDLACELAASGRIWRLTAGVDVAPAVLARAVLQAVG